MKANEFVKKFGLDLAKRDIAALDSGFIKREDFFEHHGFDILDDLKRIIESHELVESYGGMPTIKTYIKIAANKNTKLFLSLKQAILDVESCQ